MKKNKKIDQFKIKNILIKSMLNQVKGGQTSSMIIEDIVGF